uniref:Cuticular protein n=1 Tax=Nilaparvata lugens TaxID=108931 RepID=A0A2S1ZSA9_NILLU|nr:cuticular protein [Nilaparvata lugens]
MQSTMLIASLVALSAFSAYAYPSVPLAVYPAPVPVLPAVKSQFHAQDELGQYTYGYTDGLSAKTETKTFDGVTRGGYSYLDSNGIVQNVNYVSDPANGFRVAASNLPLAPVPPPAALPVAPEPVKDTPEVIAAKEAHLAAAREAQSVASTDSPAEESETPETPETPEAPEAPVTPEAVPAAPEAPKSEEPIVAAPAPAAIIPAAAPAPIFATAPIIPAPAPAPVVYSAPVPAPVVYSAPVPIVAAPAPIVHAPAPIVHAPIVSQFHSQDELGQYSHGYAGGPSAKSEIKTFDGVTRGGYSYVDANGIVQSASYVSDPVNGFRVAATNIPQPAVPVAIPDSPEVAAAKAKHFQLSAEAAAAAAAAPANE